MPFGVEVNIVYISIFVVKIFVLGIVGNLVVSEVEANIIVC